ncbi:MAG TPA: Swt1 family HEPN domain-containing protein [Beijerinckiaceae bacterium]
MDFREWMARALLFEAEAERLRDAGIKIGAGTEQSEISLLQQTLAPFPLGLRVKAIRMSRLYAELYCFENSLRELIRERLQPVSANWWEDKIPKRVKQFVDTRRADAERNTWLDVEQVEQLQFTEFGHLCDIIIENWDCFGDLIPSQHWLKQRLDEVEKARNAIAHNRYLLDQNFSD